MKLIMHESIICRRWVSYGVKPNKNPYFFNVIVFLCFYVVNNLLGILVPVVHQTITLSKFFSLVFFGWLGKEAYGMF